MLPESSESGNADEGGSLETVAPETAAELEQISPELKAKVELAIQSVEMRSHSGPLPSPTLLHEYDQVLPGLAERIVRLTEKEQAHRHEMERSLLKKDYGLKTRGQWLGLVSLFAMLSIVAFMVIQGMGTPAAALGSAIIVGVVAIFVLGRTLGESSDEDK